MDKSIQKPFLFHVYIQLIVSFLFYFHFNFCANTTGHDTDYLNLALRDGGVSLTMGLANGKQEMHIKPARVRFDDHQWHKVTVHRRIQEVCTKCKCNLKRMRYIYYANSTMSVHVCWPQHTED